MPDTHSFMLRNGVPVYFIESGQEEVMRVEFTFSAGQIKEDVPLLASTANMMLTEGTRKHSADELNGLLDFYGSFINPYSEKDRAGIVFFFLSKHLEKLLEISREILLEPVFPENELDSLMKKRLRWYINNREKVQHLAADKFHESVFGPAHPYGYPIQEADFENITRDQVVSFHSNEYDVSNLAIIVSGRINSNTPKILDELFGTPLQGGKPSPLKELPGTIDAIKGIHVTRTGSVQTSIRIGSRSINKRDQDYPGLKILNTVLGGYFGSRLMRNIREDKGYTYGISSSLTSLNLSGFKVISTDVGREHCGNTIGEIYREIELLQNQLVSGNELDIVRNYMSGEMVRMFDGPFALAESFRAIWEFGLNSEYYERLAEKIRTITPDEIKHLAQTYYKCEDLFEITAGER
jgi:predicted Zn-dependent peptidase